MTSTQKSSCNAAPRLHYSGIESLAGVHHPHAIEIQDFCYYAQIVDLRSLAEYWNDHIPGAVRIEPPESVGFDKISTWVERVQTTTASKARSRSHQPTLLYCGSAGRVSQAAAEAMRALGMSVDVLPGGWINYRRWVQAGLEVLPRLITLRVIQAPMGLDSLRLLQALRITKRQVLDIARMTGLDAEPGSTMPRQPSSQDWFESQLLQQLRGFDPRLPVWTAEAGLTQGSLSLPGALGDSLRIAPFASMEVHAPETHLPERAGPAEHSEASRLPPLMVTSFEPNALLAGLTAWLPTVEPRLVGT